MKKTSKLMSMVLTLMMVLSLMPTIPAQAEVLPVWTGVDEMPSNIVPVTELSDEDVNAILFDGLPYKGTTTKVFAYWGMPKDVTAGEKVPGVVLVHGGNGTAYKDWVKLWNDKGYAAIAIYWGESKKDDNDAYECDPAVPESYGYTGDAIGPRIDSLSGNGEAIENQWMYHAVGKARQALSFLAGQDGVDSNKIGICGISWGGVITSYTIGVDNRAAFAVPIFGCGYLNESKAYMGSVATSDNAKAYWNPSLVLKDATTPTLFVNGDSDPWFSADITAMSATEVDNSRVSMVNGLNHGHTTGFAVDEAYDFADSIVKADGVPMASFSNNRIDYVNGDETVMVDYTSESPLVSATLWYTTEGIVYASNRTDCEAEWQSKKITLDTLGEINCELPEGTVGYYISTIDELGRVSGTAYTDLNQADVPDVVNVVKNTELSYFTEASNFGTNYANFPNGSRDWPNASTLLPTDTTHGQTKRYYYAGASTTMGGVERFTAAEAESSKYKMLSFEFFIYDNTISYEIVPMGDSGEKNAPLGRLYINENNLNTNSDGFTISSARGVVWATGGNSRTSEMRLDNKKWHKIDVIFSETENHYYVDGEYLVSIKDFDKTKSFDGWQIVNRAGKVVEDSIDSAKSGFVVDNIRISTYDPATAPFYGEGKIDGNNIKVDFSETLTPASAELDYSKVKVYDSLTGEQVTLSGTPTLSNYNTTLNIPFTGSLTENARYLIDLPEGVEGISGVTSAGATKGKKLASKVYADYIPETKTYLNEGFSDYETLVKGSGVYDDIVMLMGEWASCINVKDLSNSENAEDKEHGKVFYVNETNYNTEGGLSGYRQLRYGIKSGDKGIDLTKGDATIEFDLKLINTDYTLLNIQPYTEYSGVSDSEQVRMYFGGASGSDLDRYLSNNASLVTYKTQLCNLGVSNLNAMNTAWNNGTPLSHSTLGTYQQNTAWFSIRTSDKTPLQARQWANATANSCASKAVELNEWKKFKFVISGGKISTYVDGDLVVTTNIESTGGEDRTDILKGVRFYLDPGAYNTAGEVEDFLQIDNVKFTGPNEKLPAHITKLDTIDQNGRRDNVYADTKVKASTDKIVVSYSEPVDVSSAAVSLSNGTDTVQTGTISYDANRNQIIIPLNDLMETGADYTLAITGVKDASGNAAANVSTSVSTSDAGELLINNLKFYDASGARITDLSAVAQDQKVYMRGRVVNTTDSRKDVLMIFAARNGETLGAVKNITVAAQSGSKTEIEDELELTVNDITELKLSGYVWESGTNKPLTAVVHP